MSGKLFLSKFLNKIDKKNRTSIPPIYRNILKNCSSIVIYPSIKNDCIECCDSKHLEKLFENIKKIEPYSQERDAFETIMLGSAHELMIDNEGRITIPIMLIQEFKLHSQIAFIGKGEIFEMWNPQILEAHINNSRKIAKENLLKIRTQ